MAVNWRRKKSVTLKWLGAGPGFLLYLVFLQNMDLFRNGMTQGILLSAFFTALPGALAFFIYWPTAPEAVSSAGAE